MTVQTLDAEAKGFTRVKEGLDRSRECFTGSWTGKLKVFAVLTVKLERFTS